MHIRVGFRIRVFTAAVTCGLLTVSCSTDTSKSPASDIGGTLIESIPADITTLYPPMATLGQELVVVNSIFDHLADIGPELNTVGEAGFKPQLATGWKWAADSLSIAFSINPAARWHDGKPVRAEDVKFTFKAYSDTSGASAEPGLVGNIDSVSVADSLTAVVWYKRRSPRQFMEATYNMYIMPSHILGQIPVADLPKNDFARLPVGSGRFRFSLWDPAISIVVVADSGNYRQRAKLDRVIWNIAGTTQNAALSVFSGESDFFEKLSPDNMAEAEKSTIVNPVAYSQVGYSFLTFNLHARKSRTAPHPIFGDERVRRALTYAVDRDRLTHSVLDTFGTPGFGPAPRALFPDPAAIKQLPFDLPHAKALLDSAGWTQPNEKSVRSKNGVPLVFDVLVTATSLPRITYVELLAQQWVAAGAKLNVRILQGNLIGAALEAKDFDTWMGAYNVTPGLAALPVSWSARGARNYGSYNNPKFDADVDSALTTTKADAAKAYWVRAFNTIVQDAPALWAFEEESIGLFNKRVRPTALRADAWFAGLADWTIDPSKRLPRDKAAPKGAVH